MIEADRPRDVPDDRSGGPVPLGPVASALVDAARRLSDELACLSFPPPVSHVYDPLRYAWAAHRQYIERFATQPCRVVFLGMNPGPFGMMQTGVPFGEVAAVRDWMGVRAEILRPAAEHPSRPIEGFGCRRSEVSGRRLWGWAARRFGTAQQFFEQCFVLNYCPLVFLEASGRNFTPDRLQRATAVALQAACDRHLLAAVTALRPDWVLGVGAYARQCAERALVGLRGERSQLQIAQILHPSPASPAANRGWEPAVDAELERLGVFSRPA
jgi:single-strand selective monofunctional uracil DNA glycosylase